MAAYAATPGDRFPLASKLNNIHLFIMLFQAVFLIMPEMTAYQYCHIRAIFSAKHHFPADTTSLTWLMQSIAGRMSNGYCLPIQYGY